MWRLVFVGLLACGHRDVTVAPHAEPWVASLRATIDHQCADCHDGDPKRPDLAKAIDDRELAWKAADLVASGEMPPDNELLDHEREDIVAQFCRALGKDAQRCMRGTYVGELPALVRTPKVLSADIAKTWQFSPKATEALNDLNSGATSWYTYDTVNFRSALSLAALRGCSTIADGTTVRPPAEVERCIRGILDREFLTPPPLPGTR